jgi:hypothetical protein
VGLGGGGRSEDGSVHGLVRSMGSYGKRIRLSMSEIMHQLSRVLNLQPHLIFTFHHFRQARSEYLSRVLRILKTSKLHIS